MRVGRRGLTVGLLVSLAALGSVIAQERPLAFAAVSVKVNRSMATRQDLALQPGGRFTATNAPLSRLISGPYGVQEFQIVGLPAWATTTRFDIVANADFDPTDAQALVMLKALLIERFHLRTHTAKREETVFALSVARADGRLGPGLRVTPPCTPGSTATSTPEAPRTPATDRRCRAYQTANGRITGVGNTMPRFAGVLERFVGHKVIDRTALGGTYDLKLEWTPEARAVDRVDAASTGQAIFTALREQLGLKLESTKAPVDVLVIDSIDIPSPD